MQGVTNHMDKLEVYSSQPCTPKLCESFAQAGPEIVRNDTEKILWKELGTITLVLPHLIRVFGASERPCCLWQDLKVTIAWLDIMSSIGYRPLSDTVKPALNPVLSSLLEQLCESFPPASAVLQNMDSESSNVTSSKYIGKFLANKAVEIFSKLESRKRLMHNSRHMQGSYA